MSFEKDEDLARACSGNDSPEGDDYENKVGHRRPPKHTRWLKGIPSPNPGGRPRKKTSSKHFLEQIAARKVPIKSDGRSNFVTTLEAIITIVKLKSIGGHAAASCIIDELKGTVDDELDQLPKAVFIAGEKMTDEEWVAAAAAYLAGDTASRPSFTA